MGFNEILTTILLIAGILLIAFLIVLCIKLLYTTEKLNVILNDIEAKLKSVNGVFAVIDTVTDAVSTISDSVVTRILMLLDKIFKKKEK